MINKFMEEVVSLGAEALLPQNLNEEWLDLIYVGAGNFLKTAINEGEEPANDLSDINSMLMLAAVTELSQHNRNTPLERESFEIEEETFFEYLSCYALSAVVECICRESGIEVTPPSLETIFDRERLFEIEMENPNITTLLNLVIDPDKDQDQ